MLVGKTVLGSQNIIKNILSTVFALNSTPSRILRPGYEKSFSEKVYGHTVHNFTITSLDTDTRGQHYTQGTVPKGDIFCYQTMIFKKFGKELTSLQKDRRCNKKYQAVAASLDFSARYVNKKKQKGAKTCVPKARL